MGRTLDRGPGRAWLGLLILLGLAGSPAAGQGLSVPAVPYLPQPEALCGGASLAMVMRYWGVAGVVAEDFRGALNREGTGIPADALAALGAARGFRAFPFHGDRAEMVSHLEKGRPVIALLGAGPGRYHYVVVLAWANQRVLFHDPAVGPHRVLTEDEWQRRWKAAGSWALLVLPADGAADRVPPSNDDSMPRASSEFRERAALEFREERWSAAAELASEAVRRDPGDRFAWKLLATSRFVAGQRQEALAAWNRIGEPRLDLVQIGGFRQTPTRVVYAYLGEDSGSLLTPDRLRLVQRRIEALPAAQLTRVSYRPRSDGTAELEVNVVERPARSSLRSLLVSSAMRAVSEHAVAVDAFGIAPSGESLRVFGQWQPARSHAQISASAPHFLGLPGIVTAEALWDEQSYRVAPTPLEAPPIREQRDRASVSLAHWWRADTKVAIGVAADEWRDRGRFFSLSGEVEQRLLADHLSVRGSAAGWWAGGAAPFYDTSAGFSLGTRSTPERPRLLLDASYDFASPRAPLALWGGAGTGPARPLLLRAHPLFREGVIEGAAFGRRLLSGTAQAEAPLRSLGPMTLRAAVFADVARVLAPTRAATLVDVGAGLRVQLPGWRSALRVDLATPWGRLRPHLSVGWQGEWR